MSKAFWEGFREGYLKWFWVGIALAIGLTLGSWSHPYEQCKRKYEDLSDITECVWILEHD